MLDMVWDNVDKTCILCEMEKLTKWYKETDDFLVAEKLSGGPFIVIKEHKEEINEDELDDAHNLVSDLFGKHEFTVRMNLVEDHWHAHISTQDIEQDLSNE